VTRKQKQSQINTVIRIIAGEYRGRKLKVLKGMDIRPSSDQLREGLFNMLSSLADFGSMIFLDLYAGTGAIGLEALSRGAKKVVFIEASRKNMSVLKQNIESIAPEQNCFELAQDNSAQWLSGFADPGNPCVVFLDPPFSGNDYELILNKLTILPSIRAGSLIVIESNQAREILFPENLLLLKHRRYGSVTLDILRKQ
jgi:16S rRNA (guanine966-N2)-methyltransferase